MDKGIEAKFEIVQEQRRVKDVASARSIHNRFVQDNTLRSRNMSEVRNQLEGGRPYDQSVLDSQGRGQDANVNFGDSQAARDRTLLPYWKLVHDVPHTISTEIESNTPQSDKYQVAFAEAFDQFLKDWGAGYKIEFMNMAKNFVDFGPGVAMWPTYDSPRFAAVNTQRIYFPRNARMNPDSWDVITMVRDVSASELYIKIKDKNASKSSKDAGWNEEALKQVIFNTMGGNINRDARDYSRWADQLVQNDITVASIFEPLQLVWMYVRQFDGKIGCYVFTQQANCDEFLFENDNYCEDWHELLGCVWYDTGVDSLVHSIKGFGIKNHHFACLLNRLKGRMVDGAGASFSMNFQRSEDVPDESPPIENYGAFNILPPGITQVNVYPQIQQGMQVIEALSQNQAENNSLYRQQNQQLVQKSDTATQANILASMSGELTESSASLFLAQVGESIFTEIFRRLRKKGNTDPDAKKFVKRLKEKGVPDEIIHETTVRVMCSANAGMSSPMVRTQKYQQMLGMINLPGVNARWIIEQYIANVLGSHAVNKAMLAEGQQSNPQQRRQAMIENSLFGQGMELPVDPADAHFEHAEEHLKVLAPIAQQYQQTQQLTPDQKSGLVIGIEHCGQHMALLQNDETMKAQFQQVKPIFAQIQSIARGVLMEIQRQQQEAQLQQGGQMPPGAMPPQ